MLSKIALFSLLSLYAVAQDVPPTGPPDYSKDRVSPYPSLTDPDTLCWAENLLKIPVIDHWWQTESGWAMASNCMGLDPLPVKAGSPTKAVPNQYEIMPQSEL